MHERYGAYVPPVYNRVATEKAKAALEEANNTMEAAEAYKITLTTPKSDKPRTTREMIKVANIALAKAYEAMHEAERQMTKAVYDAEREKKSIIDEAGLTAEKAMITADKAAMIAQLAAIEETNEADIAEAAGLAHYRRRNPRLLILWRHSIYGQMGPLF